MCLPDPPLPTSSINGSAGSFGNFTIIADNPSQTCFAEPIFDLRETVLPSIGPFQVLADDPNTQCLAEVSSESANSVGRLPRYRPAYELQDGTLERAGRGPGAIPPGMRGN
jgi:FAD synthetase